MSKITTTEEANAFLKQNNITSLKNVIPVAMGEGQVVEGTDIKFWAILYSSSDEPDRSPHPLIGGPSKFLLDSGQIISVPLRPSGPDSKSFKELVLEQYQAS